MKIWVLIFVIGHGSYTGDMLVIHDFNSKEKCEIAGSYAVDTFKKQSASNGFFQCVEK